MEHTKNLSEFNNSIYLYTKGLGQYYGINKKSPLYPSLIEIFNEDKDLMRLLNNNCDFIVENGRIEIFINKAGYNLKQLLKGREAKLVQGTIITVFGKEIKLNLRNDLDNLIYMKYKLFSILSFCKENNLPLVVKHSNNLQMPSDLLEYI